MSLLNVLSITSALFLSLNSVSHAADGTVETDTPKAVSVTITVKNEPTKTAPKVIRATYTHLEFKNKVVKQNGAIYGWTSDNDGLREAEIVLIVDHRKDDPPIFKQEVVLRAPVVVDMENSIGVTLNFAKYEEEVALVKRLDGKKLSDILGEYKAAIKGGIGLKWGTEGILAENSKGVVTLFGLTMNKQDSWYKGLAFDVSWPYVKIYQEQKNDGIDWNQIIKVY